MRTASASRAKKRARIASESRKRFASRRERAIRVSQSSRPDSVADDAAYNCGGGQLCGWPARSKRELAWDPARPLLYRVADGKPLWRRAWPRNLQTARRQGSPSEAARV